MIRGSICGSFPPMEVGWGGIWDQFLPKMLVKTCVFFEHVFGQEWARRGSSGRETSAKLTAVAFSSLHFLWPGAKKQGKSHKEI